MDETVKNEPKPIAKLEEEGDIAADYLEGLLDIADLDGDIDIDVENNRAAVAIVGGNLSHLVGDEGQVLDALQELTRLAVQNSTGERSRLMLDVDSYRANRRAELQELAEAKAAEAQFADAQKKFLAVVDNAAKNAPYGDDACSCATPGMSPPAATRSAT